MLVKTCELVFLVQRFLWWIFVEKKLPHQGRKKKIL